MARHSKWAWSAPLVLALTLTACTGHTTTTSARPAPSCDTVLSTVIERIRTGDTAGAINSEMDWLSSNCPAQYDQAVDYASNGPATAPLDDGRSSWNNATAYAGTVQEVCGPFAGTGTSNDDVFLNLGLDYPNPDRFQIVLWDVGGVEPLATGTTLCITGLITLYEGVAQIETESVGSVQVAGLACTRGWSYLVAASRFAMTCSATCAARVVSIFPSPVWPIVMRLWPETISTTSMRITNMLTVPCNLNARVPSP